MATMATLAVGSRQPLFCSVAKRGMSQCWSRHDAYQKACEGLIPRRNDLDTLWGFDAAKSVPKLWEHFHQREHHEGEASIELT